MKTIFIVDDEQRIRDIYRRIICYKGRELFRVIEADSAEAAARRLLRNHVDLILLDIRLPKISGQVMFDVIRAYDPDIKIVVLSVFPVGEQKRLIPYADGYYDKSWGPIRLIDTVLDVLGNSNRKGGVDE